MFSSVAVSFPRRLLVHRNTRYCSSLSPAVLCLVLVTALRFPVLRPSFSIISFSLSLSLFVHRRLWILARQPRVERRTTRTRGKPANIEPRKKRESGREENKRGVSHPRARKLPSKSAPLSAPGNPREVRASAKIIEFLLLGRPLSAGGPSLSSPPLFHPYPVQAYIFIRARNASSLP